MVSENPTQQYLQVDSSIDCLNSNVPDRMKYLHPDYIDETLSKSSTDSSRCPLALLAETCNSIGLPTTRESPVNLKSQSPNPQLTSSSHYSSSPSSITPPESILPANRKRKHLSENPPLKIPFHDTVNKTSTTPSYLPSNSELLSILSLINKSLYSPSSPTSHTIKYCMYCGKFIPFITQLIQHIQSLHSPLNNNNAFLPYNPTHIQSPNTNISPEVSLLQLIYQQSQPTSSLLMPSEHFPIINQFLPLHNLLCDKPYK